MADEHTETAVLPLGGCFLLKDKLLSLPAALFLHILNHVGDSDPLLAIVHLRHHADLVIVQLRLELLHRERAKITPPVS